jgi:hypothetical protein
MRAIGRVASKAWGRKAERGMEGGELTVGGKDAGSDKTVRAAAGRQKSHTGGRVAEESIQEWEP